MTAPTKELSLTVGVRPQENLLRTWGRRMVSVPLLFVATTLSVVLFPVLILAALVYDFARRQATLPALRTLLLVLFGLCWECVGVCAATALWVMSGAWWRRDERRYLDRNFRLQCFWGTGLAVVGRRLFRLSVVVEGIDAFQDGPVILFMRHASSADTILPVYLLSHPLGRRLRYVLKRELLWEPCLDIVGNRLPNYFVDRTSDDIEEETARVGWLVQDLHSNEGVLIYPEGTRFSPRKREHILQRLRDKGHTRRLEQAEGLRSVLPPKLGGPLAILAHNDRADAVFCAHTGFEGSATPASLLKGELVDQTIHVRFWRVPFQNIPTAEDERIEWLYKHWGRIDRFVRDQPTGKG